MALKAMLKRAAAALLSREQFERLRARRQLSQRGFRAVRFGDFRRTKPLGKDFGYERGEPIDRYFIHQFLAQNREAIQGRVLECGNREYTQRYGGAQVRQSDILHPVAGNPEATLTGDLVSGIGVPEGVFDCVILTQTLHLIYEFQAALATVRRSLKPGGILLATFPSITQVSAYDAARWGDYWRFTGAAVQRLLGEHFGEGNVQIRSYGNVLTATSFLFGLASSELTERELNDVDPDFVMLVGARARKP